MKTIRDYSKALLGYNDKQPIYLSPPSWDCGWYWGFGYLGNKNCHYHIDGLSQKHGNINLKDAIDKEFGETYNIRPSDRWTLAELFKNFYDLSKSAYLLGKGGSHLSTSPSKDVILNTDEADRINKIVLPHVFDEIYKIIERNKLNEKHFKEFALIDLQGDSSKTLAFMKEKSIHPDDLIISIDEDYSNRKFIEGFTKNDHNRIHGIWWKDYHANKNK